MAAGAVPGAVVQCLLCWRPCCAREPSRCRVLPQVLYGKSFCDKYGARVIPGFRQWVENIANGELVSDRPCRLHAPTVWTARPRPE